MAMNDRADLIARANKALGIVKFWVEDQHEAEYFKQLTELKNGMSMNKGFHIDVVADRRYTRVCFMDNSFCFFDVPTWEELDDWGGNNGE